MINLQQLGLIRGDPITKCPWGAEEIPCIETSCSEVLCCKPIVSVFMLAYNHEAYLCKAIESVLMQDVNFDFELVIGEDCSTDKTREICFEYQRKHPDKIRVLWSEHNVNDICGNPRRVLSHCRGRYIAFCEGDDYWTDKYKLAKQVVLMETNPSVALCFADGIYLDQETGGETTAPRCSLREGTGLIDGRQFFEWLLVGKSRRHGRFSSQTNYIMTVSAMVRRDMLETARQKFEVFAWRLCLGDVTMWLGLSAEHDVCYLNESVCVYRHNVGGVTSRRWFDVMRDAWIVRLYYATTVRRECVWTCEACLVHQYARHILDPRTTQSERIELRSVMMNIGRWREAIAQCDFTMAEKLFVAGRVPEAIAKSDRYVRRVFVWGCRKFGGLLR